MARLVALGELLIDFTESGRSDDNNRLFEQNPGGAPANVACAVAKLGGSSAFIGKVGQDMHGEFLKQSLSGCGVDVSGVATDPESFTTLAFVAVSPSGERSFSFARKPGADTRICKDELPTGLISGCEIFHFGSLSLTDEPARSATIEAVKTAKAAGALISYDPNYRASLWKNEREAVAGMRLPLPMCDLVKISDEETELVTGFADPERALDELSAMGVRLAAVTLGKDGAILSSKGRRVRCASFEVKAVDTTGAGDAFWGALLYRLLIDGDFDSLSRESLAEKGKFANAAAALCIGKRGGIPAMPKLPEIKALLKQG